MSDRMLLIPHLRIHNANALSSPYTIGFPAMTAWLGAMHALQRKLNQHGINITFNGIGVVSHRFDLQTYQGPSDYVASIIGTGNPLEPKADKNKPKGNAVRPSFIEEARCHLTVSLVIQYTGINKADEAAVLEKMALCLQAEMKIAGGDILSFRPLGFFRDFAKLKLKLMPGYAIIERNDLMREAMEQGQDALDALLDYVAVHHHCTQEEQNGKPIVHWQSKRKTTGSDGQTGWIIPIASGFHAISPPAQAKNQRDADTPHRFAESIVTLGEFKMPYKIENIDALLWHYQYQPENNLYLCQQSVTETDGF